MLQMKERLLCCRYPLHTLSLVPHFMQSTFLSEKTDFSILAAHFVMQHGTAGSMSDTLQYRRASRHSMQWKQTGAERAEREHAVDCGLHDKLYFSLYCTLQLP